MGARRPRRVSCLEQRAGVPHADRQEGETIYSDKIKSGAARLAYARVLSRHEDDRLSSELGACPTASNGRSCGLSCARVREAILWSLLRLTIEPRRARGPQAAGLLSRPPCRSQPGGLDRSSTSPLTTSANRRGIPNVLGDIKFLFPNKYDVYMHDTPDRRSRREIVSGLSHGCMRVENPKPAR